MPEKKKTLFARIAKNPWKSAIPAILIILVVLWWSPRKSTPTGLQNFTEDRDTIV
ncbi:MAG: hypothetical protein LBD75_01075 [Candidatus Peribacteria bacterium]|jgi:hypothetical protein|nr:hypothetical protein [Candidatus Peribacteria bacterium]